MEGCSSLDFFTAKGGYCLSSVIQNGCPENSHRPGRKSLTVEQEIVIGWAGNQPSSSTVPAKPEIPRSGIVEIAAALG